MLFAPATTKLLISAPTMLLVKVLKHLHSMSLTAMSKDRLNQIHVTNQSDENYGF